MTFKVMPEVQLRVDSAYPGDQGGGKARLDPETMLLLKISPGDLVAIEGRRRTVAKVWRALVEDWNQRKIRIDNFTRMNAGVSIGDTVKVVKIIDEVEAKRVVLAPPEDLPKKIPIANNPHVLNGLIDFPVAKNDSVPIMLGLPFIQPQIVAFKVVEIEPEELVISQRLSRDLDGYSVLSPTAVAARQLQMQGTTMQRGQQVRFIYTAPGPGVHAWDMSTEPNRRDIDVRQYKEIAFRAIYEILQPLGIRERVLKDWIFNNSGYVMPADLINPAQQVVKQELPLLADLRYLRVDKF